MGCYGVGVMEKRYGSKAEKQRAYRERKKQERQRKAEIGMGEEESKGVESEKRAKRAEGPSAVEVWGALRLGRMGLTETDVAFERDKPGYYIFDGELRERECCGCGERFETRLGMNRFCGPQCKWAVFEGEQGMDAVEAG